MIVNGRAVTLKIIGDTNKASKYFPIIRRMLKNQKRILSNPPVFINQARISNLYWKNEEAFINTKIIGLIQKAYITISGYPQIGVSATATEIDGSVMPMIAWGVFKVKTQPPGTPEDYGDYAFTIQHEAFTYAFDPLGFSDPYAMFYRANDLWVILNRVAYKAPIKPEVIDPAYPTGTTLGDEYELDKQMDLPWYTGSGFYGQTFYRPVFVASGFWYNYVANCGSGLTEADIVVGGSTNNIDLIYSTELIRYKASAPRITLKSGGTYVYQNHQFSPARIIERAGFAANENRMFYVGSWTPITGSATDGASIYLSYVDFFADGSSVATNNVLLYKFGYDAGVDDTVWPYGIVNVYTTKRYLYILAGRILSTENKYSTKLFIVNAQTISLIQIIDFDDNISLSVQYKNGRKCVARSTAYWNEGNHAGELGIIQYNKIYDIVIDKNGIHTFTLKHKSLAIDTTSTGSGSHALYDANQSDIFINQDS